MGKILSILSSFFGLVTSIVDYIKQKDLIKAGEDKQARKQSEKVLSNVEEANNAKRDNDILNRVRNKYNRDK